jgi:hypothetical protein
MADGSHYLKCDICGAVVDRRPVGDYAGKRPGVFAIGEHDQLLAYAKSLGWVIDGDRHICPIHADE